MPEGYCVQQRLRYHISMAGWPASLHDAHNRLRLVRESIGLPSGPSDITALIREVRARPGWVEVAESNDPDEAAEAVTILSSIKGASVYVEPEPQPQQPQARYRVYAQERLKGESYLQFAEAVESDDGRPIDALHECIERDPGLALPAGLTRRFAVHDRLADRIEVFAVKPGYNVEAA